MKKKEQKLKEDVASKFSKNDKNEEEHPEEIIINHNVELEELKRESKEYFELAQRTMAEFDNYKKRTVKEKEMLYADAVSNIVVKFLPVLDSFDSALRLNETSDNASLIEGLKMVRRQFEETLKNLGIEEIKSVGEKFDPKFHYAVMHIDDAGYGDNEIIEELQKGYIINEKVIRHSMVKVAN